MRKLLLSLILLILVSLSVSSLDNIMDDSVLNIKTIKSVISSNEDAVFEVNIRNTQDSPQIYKVYYDGLEWYLPAQTISIDPGKIGHVLVKTRPLYVGKGQYALPLNIRSTEDGMLVTKDLVINVIDSSRGNYVPSVAVRINVPEEINPNQTINLIMDVKNKNPLKLDGLVISINSDYFSKTFVKNLNSTNSDQTSEIHLSENISLNKTVKPQKMGVHFSIVYKNTTIYNSDRTINVLQYSPKFRVEKETKNSFLKSSTIYNITNEGNVPRTESHKIQINLLRQLFSYQKPVSSLLKENGNRYLMWTIELDPGESTTYTVSTNYRSLFIAFIILGLVVVFYFMLRSPLTIKKTAKVLEMKEGGISMLKVMITLKNISGRKISDVKIKDYIPNLASYIKEEHVGSLAPSRVIVHERKGTTLVWDIGDFDSFEERIISYKIKTKLNILGGLSLKESVGQFKKGKGKMKTKSTPLKLVIAKKRK